MISPRANQLQKQSNNPENKPNRVKFSQQPYVYKARSPVQPRTQQNLQTTGPNKGVNNKNFLSPKKDYDAHSEKSHHSRRSSRSIGKRSNASFKSFETIYSRQMLSKHEPCHPVGYTDKQITESIDYIFEKYDDNRNDLLEKSEVLQLVRDSLRHIGSNHEPSQLEVNEFIQHIDKNNDGKLSRKELEKAFFRAGHSLN